MKKRIKPFLAVGLLLSAGLPDGVPARAGPPPALPARGASEGLAERVSRVLDPLSRIGATSGVAVVDLADGSVVCHRGAEKSLIPASNQKLLVMAAAVDILGPSFEFRTVLGWRGRDLVVVGDGDPAFGDAKALGTDAEGITAVMEEWAARVREAIGDRIEGDLIVDETIFDEQWTHPSWESSDLGKWYGAPVGGLNLNGNCIELTVQPATQAGGAPRWSVNPPCALVQVDNRARSSSRGVPVVSRLGETFRYGLSGTCGTRVRLQSVPIPDPGLFFADVLRGVFERNGVVIARGVRRERVRGVASSDPAGLPEDLAILAEHRTPLSDVLRRVGEDSQNMFAECLAKRVGYEHMRRTSSGVPKGRWVTAAAAINAFLRRIGVDTDGNVVSDASGLSRANRLTADQIVRVLVHMHRHPAADLFAGNLAVAGVDGSLRKRMRDIEGRVVGKTGTLRGVKTLSGYVLRGGRRRFAFSFLVNGIEGSNAHHKRLQDDLCRVLAEE